MSYNSEVFLKPTMKIEETIPVVMPNLPNVSSRFLQNPSIQYEDYGRLKVDLQNTISMNDLSGMYRQNHAQVMNMDIDSGCAVTSIPPSPPQMPNMEQAIHMHNLRNIFRENIIYNEPIQENDVRIKQYYDKILNSQVRVLSLEEVEGLLRKESLRKRKISDLIKTPLSSEKRMRRLSNSVIIPNVRRRINFDDVPADDQH